MLLVVRRPVELRGRLFPTPRLKIRLVDVLGHDGRVAALDENRYVPHVTPLMMCLLRGLIGRLWLWLLLLGLLGHFALAIGRLLRLRLGLTLWMRLLIVSMRGEIDPGYVGTVRVGLDIVLAIVRWRRHGSHVTLLCVFHARFLLLMWLLMWAVYYLYVLGFAVVRACGTGAAGRASSARLRARVLCKK